MSTEPRVIQAGNNINIIDPNPEGHTINHEDLYIYASLVAKTKGRSFITQKINDSYQEVETIPISTVDLMVSDSATQNKNKRTFLSTNWTEIGGSQFKDTNVSGDLESFGITNIDIEIKGSYIPKVVIDFVDIRGATLFEQGSCSPYSLFFHLPYPVFELTLKGYYGKPVTYYLNLIKFNTKFNSQTGNFESRGEFIGWSYAFLADILMGFVRCSAYMDERWQAREILKDKYDETLKYYIENGIYDPTDYPQDSDNTVTINGDPQNRTQPFCKQEVGGVRCVTLSELHKRILAVEEFLAYAKGDDDYQDLSNLVQLRNDTNQLLNDILDFSRELQDLNYKPIVGNHPNRQESRDLFKFDGAPDDNLKEIFKEYWERYIEGNEDSGLGIFARQTAIIKDQKVSETECGGSKIAVYSQVDSNGTGGLTGCDVVEENETHKFKFLNGLDNTGIYFQKGMLNLTNSGNVLNYVDTDASSQTVNPGDYYIDLGWYIDPIEKDLATLDEEIEKKRNAVKEAIDAGVTQKLGFRPTIRNVFTVLNCNVETFVQLLLNCCILAEQQHNENINSLNSGYGGSSERRLLELRNDSRSVNNDEQKVIYPWPTYYEENFRNTTTYSSAKKTETKEVYPGENTEFFDWWEVRFVEDFIKACEKLNQEDEALAEDLTGIPGFDNYIPINPLESQVVHNGTDVAIKYRELLAADISGRSLENAALQIIGERMFMTLDFTYFDPVRYNPLNLGLGYSIKSMRNPPKDELISTEEFNKKRLWMGGIPYFKIDASTIGEVKQDEVNVVNTIAAVDANNLLSCIEDKRVLSQLNLLISSGDLAEKVENVFKDLSKNQTEPNSSNLSSPWFNTNYSYTSQNGGYGDTTTVLENNIQDIEGWNGDQYWAYHPAGGFITLLSKDSRAGLGDPDDKFSVKIYTDISQMKSEFLFQMWTEDERGDVRQIQFNDKPEKSKQRKEDLIKLIAENNKDAVKNLVTPVFNYITYSVEDKYKLTYFDGSADDGGKGLFTTLNIDLSEYDKKQNIQFEDKFGINYAALPLFLSNLKREYAGNSVVGYGNIYSIIFPFAQQTMLMRPYNLINDRIDFSINVNTPLAFTTELPNRGIFTKTTVTEDNKQNGGSYTFGENKTPADNLTSWEKLEGVGVDTRYAWGNTIVHDTLVQLPLWLDNVNRFRKATVESGGRTTNVNDDDYGYKRPLTTSTYELKGPPKDSINRTSDYTSKEIERRNLAYLFLASCKFTPFISWGVRQKAGEDAEAVFNYINEHYPKSIVPFASSGTLTKVPKGWVLGMGSVLWRWKMYMGVEKDTDGNIRWRHPNFKDLPIGFDPLAQPGHPSVASKDLKQKTGVLWGKNICAGCGNGRQNRSATQESNELNIDTYENKLYFQDRDLWPNRHETKDSTQLSCFASSSNTDVGRARSYSAGSSITGKEYLVWGCNFDYWGVYNNDTNLNKTRPNSWTKTNQSNSVWRTLYYKFIATDDDGVYDVPDASITTFDYDTNTSSVGRPFQVEFRTAKEASINTYWPLLWITPWQHFYTEPINFNGSVGYYLSNQANGTNDDGYNTGVEKTLTFIPYDMPYRDYAGNFGHLGQNNSNAPAGQFKASKKFEDGIPYDITISFITKNEENTPLDEQFSYTNTKTFYAYGCEIDGTNVKNWFTLDGGRYAELIALLPTFVKERFVKEFEDWCDSDWDGKYLKIVDPVNFSVNDGNDLLGGSYRAGSDKFTDQSGDYYYALSRLLGADISSSYEDRYDGWVGLTHLDKVNDTVKNKDVITELEEQLFKKYYWIMTSTPKLFGLDVLPGKGKTDADNKSAFMANKKLVDKYLEAFQREWKNVYKEKEEDINSKDDEDLNNDNVLDDEDTKLSLYRTFKSICDKWISSSERKEGKHSYFFNITDADVVEHKGSSRVPLAGHFTYVNRVMGEIGNRAVIDVTKLKTMRENPKISFYNLISDLLGENKFDFFPLPSYVNFTTIGGDDPDKVAREMFSPYTNNISKVSGPNFICMYVGGTSRIVSLKPKANCPKDQEDINYNDDGFSLSEEGGDTPKEIKDPLEEYPKAGEFPEYKDNSRMEGQGFTAFRVAYGLENQNHFKSVELDQTEFTETNESLMVISKLADGGNPADRTQKGNNLHNIYLTRSYTCKVASLGNMMIQPLQYFELTNIPMFYGTYLITEVTHNVKPHHIETNFKGVRQPIATVPVVEDVAVAMSQSLRNIEAKSGRDVLDVGGGGGTGGGGTGGGGGSGSSSADGFIGQYQCDAKTNIGLNVKIEGSKINKTKITSVAESEISKWGSGSVDEGDAQAKPMLEEYAKRTPGASASQYASDASPWSAAFISYVMSSADSTWPKSTLHYDYITNAMDGKNGYEVFPLSSGLEIKAEVGDLFCKKRDGGATASHCDVIYKTTTTKASLVGGNLDDTVGLVNIDLTNGYVTDSSNTGTYRILIKKTNNKYYSGKKIRGTGSCSDSDNLNYGTSPESQQGVNDPNKPKGSMIANSFVKDTAIDADINVALTYTGYIT